ncbi:RluA family pseudouridine synthase [Acidaminobacter sp. JC074]|uniref:RluA family pseudouridine synthase n=1 Tax=Acidaminobacter sp. JC074 TaxID=2530199 RepID=UPI001F0DB44A|nr:RluA family pseudouridine synthase [Acidaminobacter sp. JC074]MCH4890384.1 RluA family pseudouridine synthase [Acidaminobacter sp. JC074]
MRVIKVTENEMDQRLDRFLTKYLNNTTKTNIFKLIRKKRIKVNGKRAEEKYFLKLDDEIQIHLHDNAIEELMKPLVQYSAEDVELDVVYEDDDILIVNKPVGLLTHPDSNEYKNTLSSKVQVYLKHLSTRTFKPASIQRLDKNTSGLVIFGKTYSALKEYNALMRDRKIGKFYMAVVSGKPKDQGQVKGYLVKDEATNKVKISSKSSDESKFVHTKYKVLSSNGTYSLLEVELLTGRTHQIRGSLAYAGFPIVGDVKYGGEKLKGQNQLLHAYKVVIGENVYEKRSDAINTFVKQHNLD